MTEHEVLVAARNAIARKGWWNGRGGLGEQLCVALAIDQASKDDLDVCNGALREFSAAVGLSYKGPPTAFGWNDAEGRTERDVLNAFDRAIFLTAPEPDTSFLTSPSSLIRQEVVA